MFLLERGVLALDPGQLRHVALLAGLRRHRRPGLDPAFARLLAPARQHERMNVQRLGDVLNLDAGELAELHRLELEFSGVAMNLPWTRCPGHHNPLCPPQARMST